MDKPPYSLLAPDTLAELCRLADLSPDGKIAEIGVYQGGSAWHLASTGRELHLFDTFTGIPFKSPVDSHVVGDFGDTSERQVRELIPTAILHVGVFPQTLPPDLFGFGFVHVDCDQYQSVRDAIDHLGPRMLDGGLMVFDDYGHLEGATLAVDETFGRPPYRSKGGRAFFVFGG